MNEKVAGRVVEVEGVEMIDMGNAMAETRQPHSIMQIRDSAITWTYAGFDE